MARTRERQAAEAAWAQQAESLSSAALAGHLGIEQSAVSALAVAGMPRNADGSYAWSAVREWLKREGRSIFRPAPAAAAPGATDHAAMLAQYRALEAKREYEERAGLLIARADAERDHLRVVLAIRASLLAMPEQIAAQISNLGAREVAAALRERVQWICEQHRDGKVAIPPALVEAIDRLVDEHRAASAPEAKQ